MRRQVFVDSWAWLAWAASDDPAHERAVVLRRELYEQGALLVTSRFVLAESLTRLRYDVGLPSALALVEAADGLVEIDSLDVIPVEETLWQEALGWFRRFDDQMFSFVDCTSFAIMHARAINEDLTGDRHFAVAGFTPLGA